MKKISKKIPFGERNFVERQKLNNLEYNSVVCLPVNGYAVVFKGAKNQFEELSAIDGHILNPKPKGLNNLFKKIDETQYTIFFISSSSVSGNCGANVLCKNENIPDIQYEKVHYRVWYEFKVTSARQFIKTMISKDMEKYSQQYFTNKINDSIKIVIEEKISQAITSFGLENFYCNILKIKEEIQIKLNQEVLLDKGIEISISSIVPEEEEMKKAIREDSEIRVYQKRKSKEVI